MSVFLLRALDDSKQELARIDPDRSEFVREMRTSAEGYAEFAPKARERAFVMAMIEKENVDARAWIGDAAEIELRIPLPTPHEVEIEVVSDKGAPIVEYTVALFRLHDHRSTAGEGLRVLNKAAGRFRCELKHALGATERLIVSVTPPTEFSPTTTTFTREELLYVVPLKIVVVEKTGGFRGVVTGTDGQPVAKAAAAWAESSEAPDITWGNTNAQGVFVLSDKAWRHRGFMTVIADGYAPVQRPIHELPSTPEGDLRIELDSGAVVEGVVTTSDGNPYARTSVIAWFAGSRPQRLGMHNAWSTRAVTDEEGRYKLEHVPQGAILVAVDTRAISGPKNQVFTNTQRLLITQPRHELDIHVANSRSVQGVLAVGLPENVGLFLQVVDDRDSSIPWASMQVMNGQEFQIQAPASGSATLRVWMHSQAVCEIAIPASEAVVELGKLDLPRSRFGPPAGW